MSRVNRRGGELREGVRLDPYVSVGEACCAPPCLLEKAQAGGELAARQVDGLSR
jgi:hypothetical protein